MEVLGAIGAVGVMFALAFLILWLWERLTTHPRSQEEIDREEAEWDRALRNPMWSFVASEFGGEVPETVRSLFGNHRLILARDLSLGDFDVARFVPATDEAFDSERWFDPPPDSYVFALTQFGDPFYIRTSEGETGYPVYLLYHDGSDIEVVAPSMSRFVEVLERAANQGVAPDAATRDTTS